MQVEIWSDIVCPFCYIGKRQFEKALGQFAHAADVAVRYRSFELNPDAPKNDGRSLHQYLAEHKGIDLAEAKGMNDAVTKYAAQVGLRYDLDRTIPANSFDAHRTVHLAAKHGLQEKMIERLHAAYFVQALDIGKKEQLVKLAGEVGVPESETLEMLNGREYAAEVRKDEAEARDIGVQGVPCFIFDRHFGVTGAQSSEALLEALEKAWESRPKT